MGALVSTVWVRKDWASEPVVFGPDSEEIPAWALEQMGDHCFEDGKRPEAKKSKKSKKGKSKSGDTGDDGSGAAGYTGTNAELQDQIDKRNDDRDEDAKIVVAASGSKPTKAELVAALEADDAANA